MEASLSWDSPASCNAYFVRGLNFLETRKGLWFLGDVVLIAIFWVVWIERNRKAFDNVKGETVDEL